MTDFLQVGQKVTMEIIRENKNYHFPTKIEDLTPEHVLLGMPMKAGNTFPTYINEKIYIYFSRKDSYYCLECLIEKRRYLPIPLLIAKPIKPAYKHQKRGYFRLKMSSKVCVQTTECNDCLEGHTVDISASGAKIALRHDIPKDSYVKLQIPALLGDEELEAIVIRTERDDNNKVYPYNIGVHFKNLEETQRDKIVKFLLAKQQKLRRKGFI